MAEEDKLRKKKKKWFTILAPDFLNQRIVGETLIEDAAFLKGKSVSANLMNLLGDVRKQQMELHFTIVNVKEGKGYTSVTRFKLSNSFLKRLIRRGRNKVDDSFTVKNKDGIMMRVKPVLITVGLTSRAVRASLVKKARAVIKEFVVARDFETFVRDLVDYRLQKELKEKLNKIYPLKQAEIRYVGLETTQKETVQLKMSKEEKTEEPEEDEHEEKLKEKIKETQKKSDVAEEAAEEEKDEESEETKEEPEDAKEEAEVIEQKEEKKPKKKKAKKTDV
ncbi:hypothetical protein C4573_05155 [Candidatus Woesearchaeota archaeon]|nr:MAG: hypothetical protein C4573_05155 [Candidatus Woesearchaeota archaeon]